MPAEASTRILLTGARGMIGRQILAHLPEGAEVIGISRSAAGDREASHRISWKRADLRDPDACRELVAETRPTHLIHAAWNTEHGSFWSAADNQDWVKGGVALAESFARAGGRRLVVCGTCAEYPLGTGLARREDEPLGEPATLYGRSKLALLSAVKRIAAAHALSLAWARIFNVYGIGEKPARFVPAMITALLHGEPARCNSGGLVRDFIDVRDLGRVLAVLTFSPAEGVLNLGLGTPVTLAAVATTLGAIVGRPDLVTIGSAPARPDEPQTLIPDLGRMRSELGFVPSYGLDRGLRDAVTWWRDRPDEAAAGSQDRTSSDRAETARRPREDSAHAR